jgi:N-acetylglutamate synthase-like GNAT family acetyltransferase
VITMGADWNIRKAEMSDLPDIKKIADSHKRELGFVMRPVLARSIEHKELFVAVNDEGIIGFVQYHHRLDSQTTLHNIVVKPDYRESGIGQKLIEALEIESRSKNQGHILLKCPKGLPANDFYQCLGYKRVAEEQGKSRQLNIWRKTLATDAGFQT